MNKRIIFSIIILLLLGGLGYIFVSSLPKVPDQSEFSQNTRQEISQKGLLQQNELETIPEDPNILLIIADDFGLDAAPWYPEYGTQKPHTPILDSLAEQGLVFDNVWANPVCSPTRASILTGKYGFEHGVLGPVGKDDLGISPYEYSLQSHITDHAQADYSQAVIGKWHLSSDRNGGVNNPSFMDVPYYSGFISGSMQDYSKWTKVTNGSSSSSNIYTTTEFTNDAISWIDEQGGEPWFMWLAYTAPHTPFHLPPRDLLSEGTNNKLSGTESDISQNPLPYYFAAIEVMDTEIGRLLDSLSEEERENTVVIFIGDNGTPGQVAQTPFDRSTAKGSINRGGIHVPMIVSGPGVINGRTDAMVNTSDFYATIAELAGATLAPSHLVPQNSYSFASVLFDTGASNSRDYLYSEIQTTNRQGGPSDNNGWTIKNNEYQYIHYDNGDRALFIENDLGQSINLISEQSAIAQSLYQKGLSLRSEEAISEEKFEELIIVEQSNDLNRSSLIPSNYLSSYTINDADHGTETRVEISGDSRIMTTNALPNHTTGEFPREGNPNTISAQNNTYTFPINPVWTGEARRARKPGIAVNGVKFEPETAERVICESGEEYSVEAKQDLLNLGLDFNNAHVQPTGAYHYHGFSQNLVNSLSDENNGLVHIGFAMDGYLIYADAGNQYSSSYQLSNTKRTGTNCVHNGREVTEVTINNTQPDGTYVSDWEYVAGSGDLDQCNGLTIDGQYIYVVTEGYPFIGRCLNGDFTEPVLGQGGQGATMNQGQNPPNQPSRQGRLGQGMPPRR